MKRKERYDRYGHCKETLQEVIATGSDDGIRFEGRPHRVVIISANLSARPSMGSRDGAMAQSRDAVCDGLCDHRDLCGKTAMGAAPSR
jgi:hypothetical protein